LRKGHAYSANLAKCLSISCQKPRSFLGHEIDMSTNDDGYIRRVDERAEFRRHSCQINPRSARDDFDFLVPAEALLVGK